MEDALSKVQSVDQRMRLECGVGFRQLRTCRRTRPGAQQLRPYSMISSARASSECGTSIPCDLAVLRLMTNSNFVG